jgi:hypothetical protein
MDVESKRGADWPHWPDRGNGPARCDRLERRLFRDSEREAELAQAQEAIRQIEQAATEKAAEIDRLEQAIGQLNGSEPPEPEPEIEMTTYLVFAWTPGGYALHQADGEVPAVGARVSVNGQEYAVAKLARSPLPADERRCAYLERV